MDGADILLPDMFGAVRAVVADKGYDAEERAAKKREKAGVGVAIPPRSGARNPRKANWRLYAKRRRIENFFARLKQYRAIATRYDKRAAVFLGPIHLSAALFWLV